MITHKTVETVATFERLAAIEPLSGWGYIATPETVRVSAWKPLNSVNNIALYTLSSLSSLSRNPFVSMNRVIPRRSGIQNYRSPCGEENRQPMPLSRWGVQRVEKNVS